MPTAAPDMSQNKPRKPAVPSPRGRSPERGGKTGNKLAQPQNRWQRFSRYVWDKKR